MITPGHLTLAEIVGAGLCIGCGLCESLAKAAGVRLVMTPDGRERPSVSAPVDDVTLSLINEVCPGLRVDGPDPKEAAGGTTWHAIWGPAMRIVKGHAVDPEVRFWGSAGGVLSALAIYLLDSKQVDFVLHVAASDEKPMRSQRQLSFNRAEVLQATGSRYGPAAPLIDIVQLLDEGRRFAFIGKPCDVAALRNLARHDPRVARLVPYILTFFCGGASTFERSRELVGAFGVTEADVAMLRYRGLGNPGLTRVETRDGHLFTATYNEIWQEEGEWSLQFRCKICADAIGELADIAACDVWPNGDPVGEDAGFNGIVARTPKGLNLLDEAEKAGVLTIVKELSYGDLDNVQPHHVRKKQAISARLAAMGDVGVLSPSYTQLRLEMAAATSDAQFQQDNYLGMTERLQAADNREQAPIYD